jgi:hypothetical protein
VNTVDRPSCRDRRTLSEPVATVVLSGESPPGLREGSDVTAPR